MGKKKNIKKNEEIMGKNLKSTSIRRKIFTVLVSFVVFLIGLLWVFQIMFLDDFYRVLKKQQLQKAGEVVAQNIGHAQFDTLIKQLKYQNDVSIVVITQEGRVVATNEEGFPGNVIQRLIGRGDRWQYYWNETVKNRGKWFEPFATNPAQQQGFEGDRVYDAKVFRGIVPAFDPNRRVDNLLYAQIIEGANQKPYMALVSTMISPVDATRETLINQLLIVSIILLVAAVFISYLISRWVGKPIEDTNAAARALGKGEYSVPKTGQGFKEIGELNQTLYKAAQELNKVNRLQKELIANISHDLRTPLTMIGGYAEVMRDIPGEANEENIQVIIDETKRLSTLVNAIMDYSKLQAENQLEEGIFNLSQSIEDILQRYQAFTQQNGYTINFLYDEKTFVRGDELRIGQVLYNLINNAISYTGEDKNIVIKQEIIKGGQVKISVIDKGAGIPPEELEAIWDRYYRAAFHKRATIGTGLGLAIVKSILEMHRVPYGAQSEVGKGSCFWFVLPLC